MSNSETPDPLEGLMPNVYEGVRKSQLLIALHDKLRSVLPGGFAFAAEFEKLCQVIVPQIGETRVLFPEFTPHDEKLHVAKLFELADKFLGPQVYRQLNTSELFLLAAALYAHDWGMAVGADEKEYLRNGAPESLLRSSFSPLSDERERLQMFAKREGLIVEGKKGYPPLPDEHLRLYVRETHAWRSASRVRTHFVGQTAVAEALASLCEGHWHDFSVLDDPKRFPREYEVAGMPAHLLALALQVRLIDLFHITDDRTPYALWRFVSPRESRSKEAWDKHRAVHGISVIDFPPGRAIQVQGATEDEEVWSSLQDLCRYCEVQVQKALEISAGHVPPSKYGLDFIKVKWSVTTGTLRPVDIRFEFDRAAMFRMLSEDIYEGDPHVFLRELLQNAIDAIRTRRARHADQGQSTGRKKQITPVFDTTIYFVAEHHDTGDIEIICRDFGIGMDEHIIRNYFSTAGISYYRSSEFERQHLGFEPVSRFGVGILSCFMVADAIELKTYRHPDFGPPMAFADSKLPGAGQYQARRLGISIPGVDRQFVVKDLAEAFDVGTEIKVHVLAGKARRLRGWKEPTREMSMGRVGKPELSRTLRVTEELSDIAGFVEFPIHVTEKWSGVTEARRSLILNPNADPSVERGQYDEPVEVQQLTSEYPWNKVTDPESLAAASEQMTVERFDLNELLPSAGYEGWLSFPKPKNEHWDFSNNDRNPLMLNPGAKVHWYDRQTFGPIASEIAWRSPAQYSELRDPPISALLAVYRDGIRLREIKQTALESVDQVFPLPRICVNLPARGVAPPNLARTKVATNGETWDFPIWQAFKEAISRRFLDQALSLEPTERLFRLGWVSSVFRIAPESLLKIIPENKCPTVWLIPGGNLEVSEGGLERGKRVFKNSDELTYILLFKAAIHFCAQNQTVSRRIDWRGPRTFMEQSQDPRSTPVQRGFQIAQAWAAKCLVSEFLQFLKPPSGVSELLRQTACISASLTNVGEYVQSEIDRGVDARRALVTCPQVVAALELAATRSEDLQFTDRALLHKVFPFLPEQLPAALPIRFTKPFDVFAATRHGDINLTHAFGQHFCKALGAIGLAEQQQKVNYKQVEKLNEGCLRHNLLAHEIVISYDVFTFAQRVFGLVARHGLMSGFTPPPLPNQSELVPSLPGETVPGMVSPRGRYSTEMTGELGALIDTVPS